jgi:phosphopantetheinyl transferase (holo-ACP synthase)
MVFSCGIDIEEKERFNKHYFEKGKLSNLIYDIFTTKEIENFSVFGKEAFLKGFSFKEAFYKACSNVDIGFFDVEIIFKSETEFELSYSKITRAWLKKQNIKIINAFFQEEKKCIICEVLLIN